MASPAKMSLALDLGTTSLAGRLLDASGNIRAAGQCVNPQNCLGKDILSRLQQCHEGHSDRLQQLLIDGLQELVGKLLLQAGCPAAQIEAAVAAGNPGMTYLLCGLPAAEILYPPHLPRMRGATTLASQALAIGLPTELQLFPLVTGFIGGDLVAFLFGLGSPQPGTVCIDIGTNGELGVWTGDRWWVTSAAAGPAFEAANVSCGMPAERGAVVDVRLTADRLQLEVLGGPPPRGLCGSGLAALIGAGVAGGLIDRHGRIRAAEELATPLSRYLDEDGILFYRDAQARFRLSQADVRGFQLAKGALRAGLEVLLERSGLEQDQVRQVIITGAFGQALPARALKRVALLPEDMVDKTFFVSNGVLDGLTAYLTTVDGSQRLQKLTAALSPFPLSGTPVFEQKFLSSLDFQP